MLENWKKAIDTKKAFGALLTDLSKAFDCLPHLCIIAKLDAYVFIGLPALNLILNYSETENKELRQMISVILWMTL